MMNNYKLILLSRKYFLNSLQRKFLRKILKYFQKYFRLITEFLIHQM
jgi:hypothetical protein